MSQRAITQDPVPPNLPWAKWITVGISLVGFLVTVMVIVWGAAVLVTSKADKSELQSVKENLYNIKTDVEVIRTIVENAHTHPRED